MAADSMTPLIVLCELRVLDGILESYFIRNILLGDLRRPVRVIPVTKVETVEPIDNVLIINLFDRLVPLIRKFISAGCKNIGIFHMGDEHCRNDRSYYGEVDYVIRNYYFAEALTPPSGDRCLGVIWAPNGYRIGVGPRRPETLLPVLARTTTLFFAGFTGSGASSIPARIEMLDVIKAHKLPATVITTPGFAKGLGPASYGTMLENARFALVPQGQAPETIRLFDALELGCIPISLAHAFLQASDAMGGAPVVQLKSWQELLSWFAATTSSPTFEADVAERQRQCIAWWSNFKRLQATRVASLIERAFAR